MVNYTRGSNQNYYPRMELGLLMLAVRLDFWATLVFIAEIRYQINVDLVNSSPDNGSSDKN